MTDFIGFDDRKNNSGIIGTLAGIVAGSGTLVLLAREWWAWGWGPGHWSRSDIFHAYWLAFFGHLVPNYKGDLGTWPELSAWLKNRHQYDAFVASFWVPFLVAMVVGILVAWFVVRALGREQKAYIRGSRIR